MTSYNTIRHELERLEQRKSDLNAKLDVLHQNLTKIAYLASQALVPGNDYRRKLKLIYSTINAMLSDSKFGKVRKHLESAIVLSNRVCRFSSNISEYLVIIEAERQSGLTTAICNYINDNANKEFLVITHNLQMIVHYNRIFQTISDKIPTNVKFLTLHQAQDPYLNRGLDFSNSIVIQDTNEAVISYREQQRIYDLVRFKGCRAYVQTI